MLLAILFTTMAVARSISAVLVDTIWSWAGMRGVAFVAAVSQLLAVILLSTRGTYGGKKDDKNKDGWIERKL